MEEISGLAERVTFHNPDNGFCVLRLKVKGERDLLTVVGHTPSIGPGEYVMASGAWFTDREYGRQFKATTLRVTAPTTLEGMEKYLGSGTIRGIGPNFARRLVQAFGASVFDIVEQTPERLREVEGIGPMRASRIVAGWADQKCIREIMVFLHSHGVSTSRAVRIFKTYGTEAIALVSENPCLARDHSRHRVSERRHRRTKVGHPKKLLAPSSRRYQPHPDGSHVRRALRATAKPPD